MGGLFTSPVVPAERDPQRSDVEVFGVGLDGAVWYSNLTFGWRSLGGVVTSAPAAAQLGNRTFVFAVGWDGGLYYLELSGGVPSGWQALGGQIFSDPDSHRRRREPTRRRGRQRRRAVDAAAVGIVVVAVADAWAGS